MLKMEIFDGAAIHDITTFSQRREDGLACMGCTFRISAPDRAHESAQIGDERPSASRFLLKTPGIALRSPCPPIPPKRFSIAKACIKPNPGTPCFCLSTSNACVCSGQRFLVVARSPVAARACWSSWGEVSA